MDEQEWLSYENSETRRLMTLVFERYDNGHLSLTDAKHQIAVIVEATMKRVYDHAFSVGVDTATIDDDSTEEEVDIEFDTDAEEEGHEW